MARPKSERERKVQSGPVGPVGLVGRAILEKIPRRFGYVFLSGLEKPYTPAGLRSILSRHGIRTVYALRHTRAQRMLDDGARLEDVAAWLGHSNMATVGVYAQVRAEGLRKIAAGMKPVMPPKPKIAGERTA